VALRFYFDEDSMSRPLLRGLTVRGVDVTNAIDEGLAGQSDSAHLDYAASQGRVLFTFNVGDFLRLHTEWLSDGRNHAGLVLAPQQRYSIGEQLRRLLRVNKERSPLEMRNRAEFLSRWEPL
jgi:hypothetical protein